MAVVSASTISRDLILRIIRDGFLDSSVRALTGEQVSNLGDELERQVLSAARGLPRTAFITPEALADADSKCLDPEELHDLAREAAERQLELRPQDEYVEELLESDEPPSPATSTWPAPIQPAGYYGIAGEIVRAIEPHTESDPNGLLLQFLAMFGNAVGRGPYWLIESDEHHANLFVCLVGNTSRGRKGTGFGRLRELFRKVEPEWEETRIKTGLSSGEGLIYQVRDPMYGEAKNGAEPPIVEKGVEDKRLLLWEDEFGGTLRILARDGNSLSPVMRRAWESRRLLEHLTSERAKAAVRATGALVSIIGHVTKTELTKYLTSTEISNGLANRFMWVLVKRSKYLFEGGGLVDMTQLADRLRQKIAFAQRIREVGLDEGARLLWKSRYPEISREGVGKYDDATARAEAQVRRIAMIYALLDESTLVRLPHLQAALAVWEYSDASALQLFGMSTGNPDADLIFEGLKAALPEGMTLTEISGRVFQRNKDAKEIRSALDLLRTAGRAVLQSVQKGRGRPKQVWFACTK